MANCRFVLELTGFQLSHKSIDKVRPFVPLQQLGTYPQTWNSAFQLFAA